MAGMISGFCLVLSLSMALFPIQVRALDMAVDLSAGGAAVQEALNRIGYDGGGLLQLRGDLENCPTLYPYSNTKIWGWYDGRMARIEGSGILFNIDGQENIEFYGLDLDSLTPIDGENISSIHIVFCNIRGSFVGIYLRSATDVLIEYSTIWGMPGSSAVVCCNRCAAVTVENNVVVGEELYEGGPSTIEIDPRNQGQISPYAEMPTEPPSRPCDLVAFHIGASNSIQHNTIMNGNTAGIYATGQDGLVIWDNDISQVRQSGMDIADSINVKILFNRVTDTDIAGIGLNNVHDGRIAYNELSDAGKWLPCWWLNDLAWDVGSLHLIGTGGLEVTQNVIAGGYDDYNIRDTTGANWLHDNWLSPGAGHWKAYQGG